jgi:hypothetical protein
LLGAFFSWLFDKVLAPAAKGLAIVFGFLWDFILKPMFVGLWKLGMFVFKTVGAVIKGVIGFFKSFYESIMAILRPIADILSGKTSLVDGLKNMGAANWDMMMKPFRAIGDLMTKLVDYISNKLSGLFTTGVDSGSYNKFATASKKVFGDAFDSADKNKELFKELNKFKGKDINTTQLKTLEAQKDTVVGKAIAEARKKNPGINDENLLAMINQLKELDISKDNEKQNKILERIASAQEDAAADQQAMNARDPARRN